MQKKATVEIIGRQTLGEEQDETKVCAKGTYYKKNELHCVEYDETPEAGVLIHNVISASARGVKIAKSGAITSDMLFIPSKSKEVAYRTPYGILAMETRCKTVDIKETENEICIHVEYALYTAGELVSDCDTKITITIYEM